MHVTWQSILTRKTSTFWHFRIVWVVDSCGVSGDLLQIDQQISELVSLLTLDPQQCLFSFFSIYFLLHNVELRAHFRFEFQLKWGHKRTALRHQQKILSHTLWMNFQCATEKSVASLQPRVSAVSECPRKLANYPPNNPKRSFVNGRVASDYIFSISRTICIFHTKTVLKNWSIKVINYDQLTPLTNAPSTNNPSKACKMHTSFFILRIFLIGFLWESLKVPLLILV